MDYKFIYHSSTGTISADGSDPTPEPTAGSILKMKLENLLGRNQFSPIAVTSDSGSWTYKNNNSVLTVIF